MVLIKVLGEKIVNMQKVKLLATIVSILCVFIFVISQKSTKAEGYQPTDSPVGTNLSPIHDWSSEQPFLDVFRTAREWIPQCHSSDPGCSGEWSTKEEHLMDIDTNGWIKSLPDENDSLMYTFASTLVFSGDERLPIAGRYVVVYDGYGTLEYDMGATKVVDQSTANRDVIDVNGNGSVRIKITETLKSNYVRNIHMFRLENENRWRDDIFATDFINRLGDFSTVRFMDWMRTNGSTQSSWSTRPTNEMASYATDRGVPVETMVELANITERDPWFNIPHQADIEYITQFAELVHDQLIPELIVYVEHSNEVWNNSFRQYQYAVTQGRSMFNTGSDFERAMNWHGRRTAEICDIWQTVFGNDADRVRCVAGSQGANRDVSNMVLTCPLWTEGRPCRDHGVDYLATAPYFGNYLGHPDIVNQIESWTYDSDGGLDRLFRELESGGEVNGQINNLTVPTNGALEQSYERMAEAATVARLNNVRLIAYEGGQHLVGYGGVENNDRITSLFIEANRDPRMGELYRQYMNEWRHKGGGLFVHFSLAEGYSKWGSWGLIEYITQGGSPKYDAMMAFIAENPCWWQCQTFVSPTNTPLPTSTLPLPATQTSTTTRTNVPTTTSTPTSTPTALPTSTPTALPTYTPTPTRLPNVVKTSTPRPTTNPFASPTVINQNEGLTPIAIATSTATATQEVNSFVATSTPMPQTNITVTPEPQFVIGEIKGQVRYDTDGSWQPVVKVSILDNSSQKPAVNREVTGQIDLAGYGNVSCVTNMDGICTLTGDTLSAETPETLFVIRSIDEMILPPPDISNTTDSFSNGVVLYHNPIPLAIQLNDASSTAFSLPVFMVVSGTGWLILLSAVVVVYYRRKNNAFTSSKSNIKTNMM